MEYLKSSKMFFSDLVSLVDGFVKLLLHNNQSIDFIELFCLLTSKFHAFPEFGNLRDLEIQKLLISTAFLFLHLDLVLNVSELKSTLKKLK